MEGGKKITEVWSGSDLFFLLPRGFVMLELKMHSAREGERVGGRARRAAIMGWSPPLPQLIE